MKYSSSIVFGLAILLILAMYLFLPTKKKSHDPSESIKNSQISLDQFRFNFINKQSDSIRQTLNQLETALKNTEDSTTIVGTLTKAIDIYKKLQAPEIAAFFVYKKADYIKNTNSWEVAGVNFLHLLSDQNLDTNLYNDVSEYAIKCFEKSIQLDSNNVTAKIKLAQCFLQLSNQPMNGVQILLGIVRKNPSNVEAQLLLAKFGLVSGQLEKVAQRLENVLSLQPLNEEALLLSAELHARTGKLDMTIKDLITIKNNPKTPNTMKSQLDMAIQDLKAKSLETKQTK